MKKLTMSKTVCVLLIICCALDMLSVVIGIIVKNAEKNNKADYNE